MLYGLVRVLSIVLLKVLFRLRIVGREHLPIKGGCILASNHLSYLDPVVLGAASPRRLYFMARQSLFEIPLFGKFIAHVSAFPLKEKALGAIKESLGRLAEGKAIVVFPEGRRSPDGLLGKGKMGVGLLALRTNAPVIPTRIVGTDRALPLKAKFIRPRPVSIYFGEPLTFEGSYYRPTEKSDYLKVSHAVMERIAKLGES